MIRVKISMPSRVLIVCATQIEIYKEGIDLVIGLYEAEGNRKVHIGAYTMEHAVVLDSVFEQLNDWTSHSFDALYVDTATENTLKIGRGRGDQLSTKVYEGPFAQYVDWAEEGVPYNQGTDCSGPYTVVSVEGDSEVFREGDVVTVSGGRVAL